MASANGSWNASDSTTRTRQRHRSPRKTRVVEEPDVKLSHADVVGGHAEAAPAEERGVQREQHRQQDHADEQHQRGHLEADRGEPVQYAPPAPPPGPTASGGGRSAPGPLRLSARNVEVIAGYCSSFAVCVIDWVTCSGDLEPAMSAATLSLTSWPTAGAYAWSR